MLYIILAAVLCGADQVLKWWVKGHIAFQGSAKLIPGVVGLTHVRNTGMAFSMLSGHTWLLALISVAVSVAVLWFLLRGKLPKWEKLSLSLVLGGALGNAVDRVFQGYVVDMFEFQFVNFAVFNLADVFIDVGAVVFCVLYIVRTVREEKASKDALASKASKAEEGHDGSDHGV